MRSLAKTLRYLCAHAATDLQNLTRIMHRSRQNGRSKRARRLERLEARHLLSGTTLDVGLLEDSGSAEIGTEAVEQDDLLPSVAIGKAESESFTVQSPPPTVIIDDGESNADRDVAAANP